MIKVLKAVILILCVTILTAPTTSASALQCVSDSTSMRTITPPDSADLAWYGQKHPTRAVLSVIGLNASVWSFDRFVKHADYSYISFKTIGDNFRKGFVWDNDNLATNLFAHPYHGGLYFNLGRSNGYNFWQSSLFAFGGSFLWEMCMENEYPSTNDIIATPIGGMAIGEVTYRASDLVLDDRTSGWSRAGHEAAAFIISPMRGVTRILNGDAWRHRDTPGRVFGQPNIKLQVSAGVRALEFEGRLFDSGVGFASQIGIEYGDRFEAEGTKPYDYFSVRADLNIHSSQPFLDQLNILGRLMGHELINKGERRLIAGVYQHYDFYDSDTISALSPHIPYKLGVPASFGVGMLYRDAVPSRWSFDAFAHFNAVLLGGVLSDHYHIDNRDYNLASGFSAKIGARAILGNDRLAISAIGEFFRLFTVMGYDRTVDMQSLNPRTLNAQGDPSTSTFIVAETRLDYRFTSHLYATAFFSLYSRDTHYTDDLPRVTSTTTASRLMLTYKF